MIEDDLFPSVTQVIRHRPEYQSCHVKYQRAWHVLGALPCDTSPACRTHYGLCLPVTTHPLDPNTFLGVLDLDVGGIKEILARRREILSSLITNSASDTNAPKASGQASNSPVPSVKTCNSPKSPVQACDSPKSPVQACNSPESSVKACNSPKSPVQACNSPKPSVQACKSPKPSIQASNSPESYIQACNSPKPSVQACNSPKPSGQAFNSPKPSVQACNSPESYIQASNSPKPSVQACNSPKSPVQARNSPKPSIQASISPKSSIQACNSPKPSIQASNSPKPFVQACNSHKSSGQPCNSPSSSVKACNSPESYIQACNSPKPSIQACTSPASSVKACSTSPTLSDCTVADLAAPKRAGRLSGGSDTVSSSSDRQSGHRSSAGNLFSLELMQTDDVAQIAAQIANQAELIYQAWKTTDLNPSELIHYHSVSSDRSASLSPSSSFHSNPTSPSVLSPRTPIRNISPAPLGSSPAIPRRIIDIPISIDRTSGAFQKPIYSAQPQQSQQQYQKQPAQHFQHQQHPQYQQQKLFQPPTQQQQQPYQQPPQHQQQHQHQPQPQPQPQLQPQQQHASSPARSLNTSPRPYIPPSSCEVSQGSPQSPRFLNSATGSQSGLAAAGSRSFPSSRGASSPPSVQSQPQPPPPPPPPERTSSYVEPQRDVLADPDLEASLRELVTNFVMEDKARLSSTRVSDRPKSAPPSSIQDVLNRFERQMVITSRVSNAEAGPNHNSPPTVSSFSSMGSPPQMTSQHFSKTYPGRSEPISAGESWNRREVDSRARRSISPIPVVSQPGWNEPPPSNTCTWPLKNKQPSSQDRRNPCVSTAVETPPPPVATSPIPGDGNPTNYITTLEAHVDSQGRTPRVPIRHKVVAMPGTSMEDELLVQSLMGDETDSSSHRLCGVVDSPGVEAKLPANVTIPTSPTPTVISSRGTSTTKPKKFSISVTVDVENTTASPEPLVQSPTPPPQESPGCADCPGVGQAGMASWEPLTRVENLSAVDYAKVRFHDAQQHPKTTQRLEDYKSYSNKTTNGDGRVMQAKTRFEFSDPAPPSSSLEVPWRTVPLSPTFGPEMGTTLPEFYRRKRRKMQKLGSPEPPHALAALPHPQLTDQQKAHIRERSQSPTVALGASTAVRPFLTQGSVAERVLLFEKAPAAPPSSGPAGVAVGPPDRRRPAFSTWRDPDEVRTKAQDVISPPRPCLDAQPSSPLAITSGVSSTATSSRTSPIRDGPSSPPNKENTRPQGPTLALAPASGPVSEQSTTPTQVPPVGPPRRLGPAGKSAKNILIPRFYYPNGRPIPQASREESLDRVTQCFREHGNRVLRDNMAPLMRACQVPLYWKAPLFAAAGGGKLGHLTQEQFVEYWGRLISTCHDPCSRFVRICSRAQRSHLLTEDFLTLIQDVVDTHPGLTFLKEATEFHSRYVHTVIARIYYCVNRSWSGKITIPELRRSNLLQVISYLEEEEDINKITDYFSYEHFYVIYCKFWELDTDHDLLIDRNDLAKHNERALSDKIIDRIFSGAVTRTLHSPSPSPLPSDQRNTSLPQDKMGYQEFVWFLISEEDKRHPTAIEYWFRCMDLDGDGYLSMYELESFYEDQLNRMEALGIETLPFSDCLCQMLDMVRPSSPQGVSLRDLKRCRLTSVFYDTFFNFDKYLDHEQRDPFASNHRMDEDGGSEISDWDRYAAVEYELLVAEEGGDNHEDMLYADDEDELSLGVETALEGSPDTEVGGGGVCPSLAPSDTLNSSTFSSSNPTKTSNTSFSSSNSSPYSPNTPAPSNSLPLLQKQRCGGAGSLSSTVPSLALDHVIMEHDYGDEEGDYQY